MDVFSRVSSTYEAFGADDPFYAVLTYDEYKKGQIDKQAFYQTGQKLIAQVMAKLDNNEIEVGRGRALDFGCGVGRLTYALGEHFESAVGVDISSTMVATAEQHRRRDNCEFLVNKNQDLSLLESNTFDFVFSDITIQHIPAPASHNYVQEFVRVLRPGGLAMFLVPDGPDHAEGSFAAKLDSFYRDRFRPWYKRIRGKHQVPIYPIARPRVESLVTEAGGELLQTEIDPRRAGKQRRYQPLYYYVRKPDQAASQAA